jgi:hypothetical protein
VADQRLELKLDEWHQFGVGRWLEASMLTTLHRLDNVSFMIQSSRESNSALSEHRLLTCVD